MVKLYINKRLQVSINKHLYRQKHALQSSLITGRVLFFVKEQINMAKLQPGINDIATLRPDLIPIWHPDNTIKPSEVTLGSARKIKWICPTGHAYEQPICDKTRGYGCPYCSNQKLLTGFNDLKTKYPDIAKQWHPDNPMSPSEILYGSNQKAKWICDKGHTWEAPISYRTTKGFGCPYCSGRAVLPGFNDLETLHPDIAKEWHPDNPIKPSEITEHSGQKIKWICSNGHTWEASVSRRVKGTGCPYCKGQKAIIGETDLTTTHPELAKEFDLERNFPLLPTQIKAHSKKKIFWKCEQGHSWKTTPYSRADGWGCPYCAGQKMISGINDLETLYPDIAAEWDPTNIKPVSQAAPHSTEKVKWICPRGHHYQALISNRTKGTRCPYCAGRKVSQGFNDIQTLYPEIANEWDYETNAPLRPQDISARNSKKFGWICKRGHHWMASAHSRTTRNTGCPICNQGYRHTSLPEYIIYWYLKQLPTEVVPSFRADFLPGNREADIVLPDIQIAIEYDGVAWHNNRTKDNLYNDKLKDLMLKQYFDVIRIRENGLPFIGTTDWIIETTTQKDYTNLKNVIDEILWIINQNNQNFALPDIDISHDLPTIKAEYEKVIG